MTLVVSHQGKLYADRLVESVSRNMLGSKISKTQCGKYAFGFAGALCADLPITKTRLDAFITTNAPRIIDAVLLGDTAQIQELKQTLKIPYDVHLLVMSKTYVLEIRPGDFHISYVTSAEPSMIGSLDSCFALQYAIHDDVQKAVVKACVYGGSINQDGDAVHDVISVWELV